MLKYLFVAMLILYPNIGFSDYFKGFQCSQAISEMAGLKLDMADSTFTKKEYRREGDNIKLGPVVSNYVSYLSLDDKFYGISVDIIGKENINAVWRWLAGVYGPVIRSDRNRKSIFYNDNIVIIATRFSTHLGQVRIFCKDMYVTAHDLKTQK